MALDPLHPSLQVPLSHRRLPNKWDASIPNRCVAVEPGEPHGRRASTGSCISGTALLRRWQPNLLVEWSRSTAGCESRVVWVDAVAWATVERWQSAVEIARAPPQRHVPPCGAGRGRPVGAAGRARGRHTVSSMTGEDWREAVYAYVTEHDAIDTGPGARGEADAHGQEERADLRSRRSLATRPGTTTGG